MAKIKGAMLAAALLACLLPACTREPPNFIKTPPPPPPPAAAGTKAPVSFEAADAACREETRKKGIKSLLAIYSRLRPGQAERDYIACMQTRGFGVPGAAEPAD